MDTVVSSRPDSGEAASVLIGRARALRPLLEAAAPRIDAGRELPADVVDALHEAGLFRLLIPRDLGGSEIDLPTLAQIIEAIAEADGATAWCLGQNAGCSMTAAYLPREAAEKMFGRDPRAVLAWGAGPNGQAVPVDGGFRITGRWSYASGSRHANWLGCLCPLLAPDGSKRLEGDGSPMIRSFVFPKTQAQVIDDWHTLGLRGTGSDSYAVNDLFVPSEFHFLRSVPSSHPGSLYRIPLMASYPPAFAGVALGIARSVLDAFIDMARNKSPRGLAAMRDNAAIQSIIGIAATRLASARAYLLQTLTEAVAAMAAGEAFAAQELSMRMCTTFAMQEAVAVVDVLYHEAGASAIHVANPFERRFRDIHAVVQQIQARRANFELVGQRLLGMPTGPLMI